MPNIPLPQLPRPSTPFDMGNEFVPAFPDGTMLTETGEGTLSTPTLSLYHVLAIVWIIGIVSVLLHHFFHYVTYKKTLIRWGLPDGQIQNKLGVLKATVRFKRPLPVLICKNAKGPLVIGFVKQYIVLPHANYSDTELEFILLHELTHIKKAHVWHKLIVLVATAVHWFNPLIWQMKKQSYKDLEICCDSEVATKCDNEQLIEYGNTIIHCVCDGLVNPPSLSTYFAGNKKIIKERIANLGSIKMRKKGTCLVALCLTTILCTTSLVGCAIGQSQLPPPAAGQQPAGQTQTSPNDSISSSDTNTKPVDDTFSRDLLKQQEEFAEYSKRSGALAAYHVANVARNTGKQPEELDPHGFLLAENMSFTELLAQRDIWLDEGIVSGWIVSNTASILSSPLTLVYADESLAAPYITRIMPTGNPMFENQMFADGNYAAFEFESGSNDMDMLWFYDMNRKQIMMASTWLNQTETSVDVMFEVDSALLENLDDFIRSFTEGESGILLTIAFLLLFDAKINIADSFHAAFSNNFALITYYSTLTNIRRYGIIEAEVRIMPKFISNEKREDILFHKNKGEANKTIAKWLRIGIRSVERVLKMHKETGKVDNKIHNCGRKSVISSTQEAKIIAKIKKTPDVTLLELIEKFELSITEAGLSKYLTKRGYSFKKRQHIQQNKVAQMSKKNEENS